jgi:predicted HTH transcriptional regulator
MNPPMIVNLSDDDLLARMRNFEDHLVERKVVSDEKDWKKTAIAFANSVPVGLPAVLYIGVKDNGEIETPQRNLDEIQRKFNSKMEHVYPRIFYVPKIVRENGRQALAFIIPGSELRPHFAGLSYVRKGSETREASEEQFNSLIAQRNSKTSRILSWKDKKITVVNRLSVGRIAGPGGTEGQWPDNTAVVNCDQFYVTLQIGADPEFSFPLNRVEINFDNMRHRLQLEVGM